MTRVVGDVCKDLVPFLHGMPAPLVNRPILLLATATITDENLFSNGLFQNVYMLYRMFDSMGYAPILLVHEKPKQLKNIPEGLRSCRTIAWEDLLKQPVPVKVVIEIGMSLDPNILKFLKMTGAKLCKLYLGNILNIDIETPIFYPGMNFAHHVIGGSDRIWTSPHYGQHAEYAAFVNHCVPPEDLQNMIAPYIWDPSILERDGEEVLRWRPLRIGEEEVFVIMEPNISIQKCSVLPLLVLEQWYRAYGKGWKGKIVIYNGERIADIPHTKQNLLPALEMFQQGHIQFEGRSDIRSVLKKYPSATFVLGQLNNEFNYMTLELLWAGFPVLHNAAWWKDFGYFYEGGRLEQGAAQIEAARQYHKERSEAYKAHAHVLAWRHSPYNPAVQAAWERLLKF